MQRRAGGTLEDVRALSTLAIVFATGCATVPEPKMSFADAMGWQSAHERAKGGAVDDPRASRSLAAALERFRGVASPLRLSAAQGSPMPKPLAGAWATLLDEVDRFLQLPKSKTSVLDAVRTRLHLETELDSDRQLFGDIPPDLAERVPLALRRLSAKVTAMTVKQRRVNPATFRWPTEPFIVTSGWGSRLHPIHNEYRFHSGVDLAAELAQPVYAAETGTVVFSGWNGAHGKQVELQHDEHFATRYSHLQTLMVGPGAVVKKGQLVGLAGQTGQATGPHVHFELRRDGESIDPEELIPEPSQQLLSRGAW